MKPEIHFKEMREHLDNGGAASKLELATLEAWESGNKHLAGYLFSLQDLIASGGIAEAP